MKKNVKKIMALTVLASGIALNGVPAANNNIALLSIVQAEGVSEAHFLNAEKTISYSLDNTVLHIQSINNEAVLNESISSCLKERDVDITEITEIVFDNKVVIGSFNSMFSGMENLKSVNWDNVYPTTKTIFSNSKEISVTTVRDYAKMFYGCKSIENIDLTAILGGTYMQNVTVADNFKTWQKNFEDAFYGCESLKYVNFCESDLAYMFASTFRSNYLDNYNNRQFDENISIFSFGDNDNRNFYYDWTAYHSEKTENTSSLSIASYVTRYPVNYKLIYSIPKTTSSETSYTQKIIEFNVEDEKVSLPVDNKDEFDEIAAYSLNVNNRDYSSINFPESISGTFNSFKPVELLNSFVFEDDGVKSLHGIKTLINEGVCSECDIYDLVTPILADDVYTITFANGILTDVIKVKKGEPLVNLPIPEIEGEGYFSGWSDENGNPIEDGFVPTSNMVLYGSALCPAVALDPDPSVDPSNPTPASGETNTGNDTKGTVSENKGDTPSPAATTTVNSADTSTANAPANTGVDTTKAVKSLKSVKGFKVTAGKKKITLTWKKVNDASSYDLQVSKNKKMKKNLKEYNITGVKKVLKLKKGTYYVRVRAVNGDINSKWTKAKKISVKK